MGINVSSVYNADRENPNFTQEKGNIELQDDQNVDMRDFIEKAVYDGIRRTNPKADNKLIQEGPTFNHVHRPTDTINGQPHNYIFSGMFDIKRNMPIAGNSEIGADQLLWGQFDKYNARSACEKMWTLQAFKDKATELGKMSLQETKNIDEAISHLQNQVKC